MKYVLYSVVGTVLLTGISLAESSHPLITKAATSMVQYSLNESFDTSLGAAGWQSWSETSVEWTRSAMPMKTASASAIVVTGPDQSSAAWLVSPGIQIPDAESWQVSWQEKFSGNPGFHILDVMISIDYRGYGDPHAANWLHLSSLTPESIGFDWRSSTFPLQQFQGKTIHVAFHASLDENATWLVDDVEVRPEQKPLNLDNLMIHRQNHALVFDWTGTSEAYHRGFDIYRSADAYGAYYQIASYSDLENDADMLDTQERLYHFRDGGLVNDATYWYRICSVDLGGNRVFSEPLSAVPSKNASAIHLAAN